MSNQSKIRVWWWSEGNTRFWWYPKRKSRENFGDALTPYLVERISGKEPVFTHVKHPRKPETFFVIGSILWAVRPHCTVWGSGILQRKQEVAAADFRAVRGPKTHERLTELGYKVPPVFGDPALLLPRHYQAKSDKKYAIGIIPHYVDFEQVKKTFADKEDLLVIDLFDSVEKVVDQINACEKTVSSSLHGVIVSQAYQVPSVWVKFSERLSGDDVKFTDYFLSVGMEPYQALNFDGRTIELAELEKELNAKKGNDLIQCDFDGLLDKLMAACPFKTDKLGT